MSLVSVVGDVTTTSALAMAVAWSDQADVVVVEADPRGGSLAAWLDVPVEPSLSAAVARDPDGRAPLSALGRQTPSGVRIVPAPVHGVEAARAVDAAAALLHRSSAAPGIAVVDAGFPAASGPLPASLGHADVVVQVHRQRAASPNASAVRLERAADLWRWHVSGGAPGRQSVLAVVGPTPFEPREIAEFVGGDEPPAVVVLPEDPLAAAVLAGYRGVSPRRFRRLPLMRACGDLALRASSLVADLAMVARR